jgi:hypothetical protein
MPFAFGHEIASCCAARLAAYGSEQDTFQVYLNGIDSQVRGRSLRSPVIRITYLLFC